MKPRLLDLFCCEGGAGRGYEAAGFEVVGVDVVSQRRYPYDFVQADAVQYLIDHGDEFDVIHASPPCQAYSVTKHTHSNVHPELIEPTREALVASGKPYIIENVVGAPLLDPLTLCGSMFGLSAYDPATERTVYLKRHRLFEVNWPMMMPGVDACHGLFIAGVYGGGSSDNNHAKNVRRGGYTPHKSVREALIGVPTGAMTLHGLSQSIPPAYTRFIGEQLIEQIAVAA